MPIFGPIIWNEKKQNLVWNVEHFFKSFLQFFGKRNIRLGLCIHSQQTFRTSLINHFQTFWERSTYQSSDDLIILL